MQSISIISHFFVIKLLKVKERRTLMPLQSRKDVNLTLSPTKVLRKCRSFGQIQSMQILNLVSLLLKAPEGRSGKLIQSKKELNLPQVPVIGVV